MQRRLIVFCAAVVLVCSIGVYASLGKQKISRNAEQWVSDSMTVLDSASAWFEMKYETQVHRKQEMNVMQNLVRQGGV